MQDAAAREAQKERVPHYGAHWPSKPHKHCPLSLLCLWKKTARVYSGTGFLSGRKWGIWHALWPSQARFARKITQNCNLLLNRFIYKTHSMFFFPKTRYMRWIYRIFNGMMELGRDTELQRGWQFKLKKLQSFVLFAPFPNAGKLFYTAQFGSCFPSLGWINSCWWLRVSHKLFSLDNGEILTKLMLI